MNRIVDVAKKLNILEDELDCYGKYMAKVNKKVADKESKLILVTAINPTPYGEGKTTVSIGLHDAFRTLNKNSLAVLREPSLGPVFGMKGGATGGGLASIVPKDDINLHFTGDFHAITAANNLLCAAVYNHIYQGNELNIDENNILIKRCLDVNDRNLRNDFNITAASEVMAIFCLANDYQDLKRRLANILVGYNFLKEPIYAKDLKVDNAMALLLKQAFVPNLVQTLEGNPVLVHGGPFANIAHGCSSVVATKLALGLSDYVITEAGFGSDLGCEKFLNIMCRKAKIIPSFITLVATIRALEHSGMENLDAHIDHLKQYNVPFCVALNKFCEDNEEKLNKVVDYCKMRNVDCIIVDSFQQGGKGSIELANYIMDSIPTSVNSFNYLYSDNISIQDKINTLAKNVYHAGSVEYSEEALEKLRFIDKLNLNNYPVCIAKTQYSISDNEKMLGYPKNYVLHVRDITIQTGSEMIVVLLNRIITMPGLPKHPNFENM